MRRIDALHTDHYPFYGSRRIAFTLPGHSTARSVASAPFHQKATVTLQVRSRYGLRAPRRRMEATAAMSDALRRKPMAGENRRDERQKHASGGAYL
jgi:hypothetical protein